MVIEKATEQAFDRYRDMLINKGAKAKNLAEEDFHKLTKNDQLNHALWMCDECLSMTTNHWSVDKKSRWLGFIQAVLITNGLTTIQAERDITRPWFKRIDNAIKDL